MRGKLFLALALAAGLAVFSAFPTPASAQVYYVTRSYYAPAPYPVVPASPYGTAYTSYYVPGVYGYMPSTTYYAYPSYYTAYPSGYYSTYYYGPYYTYGVPYRHRGYYRWW
jgi:hypothetical protein